MTCSADMLRDLAEKYDGSQCADVRVEVVHCATLDAWMEVWSFAKSGLDCDRLRTEYGEALKMGIRDDCRNVNGLLLQVAVQDTSTGMWEWVSPVFGGQHVTLRSMHEKTVVRVWRKRLSMGV